MRTMLRGKIHRATVTGADLHYEGSVTIDVDLLEGADILPHEQVDIWNVTNGERFTTYALPGQRGSGVVCINGAAAHKASRGDLVIIAAFAQVSEQDARTWTPQCVFVDGQNRPVVHGGRRLGLGILLVGLISSRAMGDLKVLEGQLQTADAAWLAGDALIEIGANRVGDSALGRDLLERVQQRLLDRLTSGRFAPRERASAGNTLAHLGDPRVEVMSPEAMPFCCVPAGPFVMGASKGEEHTNKALDYDYWISRYPVTNAQFAAFVEAGGYAHAEYWREAEAQGWWKAGRFKRSWDDTARDRPYDFVEPFKLLNHPVVGVSWYEALGARPRW